MSRVLVPALLSLSLLASSALAGEEPAPRPLAQASAKQALGETKLDDALMTAVCSSALRRYYGKRRTLPRKSMVAAVPISLRDKGDTTADNQASMSLISLGTNISDPRKRLAHVMAASASMKTSVGSVKSILPTDFPSLGVPWLMEAASALYGKAKVAERLPQVANLVISNVPGPSLPLYMAGARMITNYPASIVVHGMALNITVQSYDQSLDFGLMADAKAMPDVRELADAIAIAFDDLRALPRPGDPEHDDGADEGLVSRAARQLTGRLSDAATGAVKGAVTSAVNQAARKLMSSALGAAVSQATRKRVAKTRAVAPARKGRAG